MTLVAPAHGWWRRNRWGLVLLLPLLAAALLGPFRQEAYDRFFKAKPRVPLTAAPGASVEYGGARIRLIEIVEAGDVVDYGSKPVAIPGTKIWRARTVFEAMDPQTLGGCTVQLEDTAGRLFDDRPSELSDRQAKLAAGTWAVSYWAP